MPQMYGFWSSLSHLRGLLFLAAGCGVERREARDIQLLQNDRRPLNDVRKQLDVRRCPGLMRHI